MQAGYTMKLMESLAKQKPCKTKIGISTLASMLQLEIQVVPPHKKWLFTLEHYSLDL